MPSFNLYLHLQEHNRQLDTIGIQVTRMEVDNQQMLLCKEKKLNACNLLLSRFPVVKWQAVVDKTLELLTVAIITDADDRNLRNLYASNKISHSTSISSRHAINLIHD